MNKYYIAYKRVTENGGEEWVLRGSGCSYEQIHIVFGTAVYMHGMENVLLLFSPCVTADVSAKIPMIRSNIEEMRIEP